MPDTMTVKDMVRAWLKAHGYEGLWHAEGDGCACLLAKDFMRCCADGEVAEYSALPDCEAGYEAPGDDTCLYYVTAEREVVVEPS